MFKTQILLRINKRLKDPKDREILENIMVDIFNPEIDVIETFKQYNFNMITDMKDLKITKNLSYFRSRSFKINKHVQDKLINVGKSYVEYEYECNNKKYIFKYSAGQHIVCKKNIKKKKCYYVHKLPI